MKSSAGGLSERFFTVTIPNGLSVLGSASDRRLTVRMSAPMSDTICGTIIKNRPVDRSELRSGSRDEMTARGRPSPSARKRFIDDRAERAAGRRKHPSFVDQIPEPEIAPSQYRIASARNHHMRFLEQYLGGHAIWNRFNQMTDRQIHAAFREGAPGGNVVGRQDIEAEARTVGKAGR